MPYEVICNCGQTIRGERQPRYQVVNCPGCSENVFVLPLSPFAPAPGPSAPPASRRWWRAPLLAAVACLGVLLLGFFVALPFLSRPGRGVEAERKEDRNPTRQMEAGRLALGQGKFRLARRLLGEAIDLRNDRPESLSPAASRQLNQLHRQADLLARLLPVSLEEIVRQAQLVRDPAEWNLYGEDYRSRTVVFDDLIRRDPKGRPVLVTYRVEVGDESARLALEDLTLLQNLPLDDEPRLIFGGRLLDVQREEGGGWAIRFEPDSGVLLTNLDAVAVCLPESPDKELEQTLTRQQRWLDGGR